MTKFTEKLKIILIATIVNYSTGRGCQADQADKQTKSEVGKGQGQANGTYSGQICFGGLNGSRSYFPFTIYVIELLNQDKSHNTFRIRHPTI